MSFIKRELDNCWLGRARRRTDRFSCGSLSPQSQQKVMIFDRRRNGTVQYTFGGKQDIVDVVVVGAGTAGVSLSEDHGNEPFFAVFFSNQRYQGSRKSFLRKEGHPMSIDCAILGGGPAGLNAALVLGRAKRSVVVFDDNHPRNAVTQEAHGFLTRDGVKPSEFRAIAHQEIGRYPSVEILHVRATGLRHMENVFEISTQQGERFFAKTLLLATGLKEILPTVDGLQDYYGKSLFSCPYCDGWELRDQPLVVISEQPHTFHLVKVAWNWSHDLLVCTNGQVLTKEQHDMLRQKGVEVVEDRITTLVGKQGQLERVVFANQEERTRRGGFIGSRLLQASPFGEELGCELNAMGGIVTDPFGRTTVPGVYAAGDTLMAVPHQLIIAAASGSWAAAGVNTDLTEREFL